MSAGENAATPTPPGARDGSDGTNNAGTSLPVVYLLDCDNTLLDNDALKAAFRERLLDLLGPDLAARFWQMYEEVRQEVGVVDLPLTFERFAPLCPTPQVADQVRATVMEYPFAAHLYPHTLETIAYLKRVGLPIVLSDGDEVYQPLKIRASGLEAAVNGEVMIVDHKENYVDDFMRRWPASFYVAVDDKGRILAELKKALPARFVTVQVMQGHYAGTEYQPGPDLRIAQIGELRDHPPAELARYLATPPR